MKSSGKRLLIVDPHPDVLIELQRVFEDAGFDTETAWGGGDAIRLLHRSRFDVALVSDYLPDSNCHMVLAQIMRAGNLPVVVMQAAAEAMDRRDDLLAFGASAVVCKHDLAAVKDAIGDAVAAPRPGAPKSKSRMTDSRMERVGSVR